MEVEVGHHKNVIAMHEAMDAAIVALAYFHQK